MRKTTKDNPSGDTVKRLGKLSSVKPEIIIQYLGKEYTQKDLADLAEKAWSAGRTGEKIRSMRLYVKPEENRVYYVINETQTGSVDL